MKIIIEDSESFKFFTGEGQWSAVAADGKPYASALHAYNVARHEPIGKFNIAGYVVQTEQIVNLRAGRGTGISAAVV
ncbi:MAG TPA: hypothetical protein VK742_07255 [Candidatus Sulfotelmatobacter sp.]|jgi:hypothetical protein|nr:hypothetical protein [Candidatus Sulfotelmatobacter sp.]